MAEADREQRRARTEPGDQLRPQRGHLPVVGRTSGRPVPGPTTSRSAAPASNAVSQAATRTARPSARSWWASMPVKVSSASTISASARPAPARRGSRVAGGRRARTARGARCGRPARPVPPDRRRAGSVVARGARAGTRPSAARTPAALACVSATSPAGVEWRTSVAPTGTRSRPSGVISAVRIRIGASSVCRPAASCAEQREHAGVVAPAAALVPGDHPAGVLDRAAGDRRREHRLAQHLPHVQRSAAGQQVLGVRQVGHLLEVRPDHLPAVLGDGRHHLQLLVEHHVELVGLLRVGQEPQQVGRRRRGGTSR